MPCCGSSRVRPEAEEEQQEEERLRGWLSPKTPYYFTHGGHQLHVRHWLPKATINASIFYLHGLNGHVNDPLVASFCQALALAGYAVLAFDLVGNGYSEGLRSYVKDFEDVFADVVHFVGLAVGEGAGQGPHNLGLDEQVLAQVRARPFFLMGSSMGGLIAAYASLHLQDSALASRHGGTVLVAPALAVEMPSSTLRCLLQTLVVPLAGKSLMPEALSKSSRPRAEWVQHDSKSTEMDQLDDWHRFPRTGLGWKKRMRWATAAAFVKVYGRIKKDMASMRYPILVLHDPEDRITSIAGSRLLMELAASTDKTLVEAMDALHGVLWTKPDWSLEQIEAWVGARCA